MLDYLAEEVLELQAEPIREFLLRTSVLDRLTGALCDAVTGSGGGAAMLETVERAGLFLVPLDETRQWWRYHQLFADLLRARLHQQRPGEVPSLHRAAAGWYEQHGLPDDAIRHALAAGRAVDAARLVERHVDELLIRGERDTAQRWLAALPPELSTSRPRLLLARSRVALHGGRLDGVGDLLDAAERAAARPRDPDDEPYQPSAGLGASLLANIPATIALDRSYLAALRGDAERARTLAADALAAAGEREWMLASNARGYLGIAEFLRGDLPAAERILADTVAQWWAAGELNLAARGAYHLGQVLRAGGRLDAAVAAYRQILQIAATPDRPPLPAAGMGHVGLAEVAYERGDLAAAEAELAAGLELSRQFLYAQPFATGLATLARIRQARGDAAGAREAMDEAADATAGSAATGLLNPVPAWRARLQLAQGDLAGARGRVRRTGLREDAEPRYAEEPDHLVLARVLLADGHTARATALLDRLLAAAAAQHRTGSVLEIQVVRALALAAAGNPVDAAGALVEVLALACPQGCQAVFVEEGEPMAKLLGGLVAAPEVPLECLAGLLRAMADRRPAPAARPAPIRVSGLVEPLTAREREVLELLATGMSNQNIAGTLVVTLDTVKKHVTHILTKLGATNRTEAVARARRLGLLD